MKEAIPVIHLSRVTLERKNLDLLKSLLVSNRQKLYKSQRSYMFNSRCDSYNGLHTLVEFQEINTCVKQMLKELSASLLLQNFTMKEFGISMSDFNMLELKSKNSLELDSIARFVFIPLNGTMYFNQTYLEVGQAYVLANIRGYEFSASAESVCAVFNFWPDNFGKKIWEFYKRV